MRKGTVFYYPPYEPRKLSTFEYVVRLYFSLILYLFVWLWTFWLITIALVIAKIVGDRYLPLKMAHKIWAPVIVKIMGLKIVLKGVAPTDIKSPVLIVSTHRSYLDTLLLIYIFSFPLRFLGKVELKKIPILSTYIESMGMIMVDRKAGGGSEEAIKRCINAFLEGHSVVFFPEGTRSTEGTLLPFHSSLFAAVLDVKVPIVPVVMFNTGHALNKKRFMFIPQKLVVVIGNPILPDRSTFRDRRILADFVREQMIEMIEKEVHGK